MSKKKKKKFKFLSGKQIFAIIGLILCAALLVSSVIIYI